MVGDGLEVCWSHGSHGSAPWRNVTEAERGREQGGPKERRQLRGQEASAHHRVLFTRKSAHRDLLASDQQARQAPARRRVLACSSTRKNGTPRGELLFAARGRLPPACIPTRATIKPGPRLQRRARSMAKAPTSTSLEGRRPLVVLGADNALAPSPISPATATPGGEAISGSCKSHWRGPASGLANSPRLMSGRHHLPDAATPV